MKRINRFALGSILVICILSPLGLAKKTGPQSSRDEIRSRSIRENFRDKKEDGLNVVVYLITGDQEVPVDPKTRVFKKGDQIKVDFRSNFDGYVYVVNIDPAGEKAVIYPNPKMKDTQNIIHAGNRYTLPEKNIFSFERDEKGTEILQVIMARQQVAFLEDAISNHDGLLGKTKSNAASELGGFVSSKITQVLPDKGEKAVISRSITLAPPKDKDKEGAVVTVSDKPLKPGEVAAFEIQFIRN